MLSQPNIQFISEKKFAGVHMRMSLTNNCTPMLWKSFMQQRHLLLNAVNNNLYSLQVYPYNYFNPFRPDTEFEKWALAEVVENSVIPAGMKSFVLPAGQYAVFQYKGLPNPEVFKYIFTEWLSNSNYSLDDRPHFEILGERYRRDSEESEEEIWIPVREK